VVLASLSDEDPLSQLDDPKENKNTYGFKYATIVGGLMYLANWTRPDLTTAVNKLARYLTDPTDKHYELLIEVIQYLEKTKDRKLTYTETDYSPNRLCGASDSSFNDNKDSSKSTVGWGLWLGDKCNGMIQWTSKVPKTVATSSTNAEVQAAIGLAKDTLWIRTLLDEWGFRQKGSTIMYQDNEPAIQQIRDTKGTAMSKHYLVLLRKLQELVHLGVIHMNPIDTHENVADLFTKPLREDKFLYFSQQAVGDYIMDTHAYLITDFRKQKQRRSKDGGSVQTYERSTTPRESTIMKALAHAERLARGDEDSGFEHTQTVAGIGAFCADFRAFGRDYCDSFSAS